MKHVFKSDEVAHIWAQQKQNDGRNPQGNFYFEGKTIYSYGSHFPVASFADAGTVLLTTRGYSPTTSKHIRQAWDAASHFKIFRVDAVDGFHNDNLERYIKDFPAQQKKAVKSRKYAEAEQNQLRSMIANAAEYAEHFKKSIEKKTRAELKRWKVKAALGVLFTGKELERMKATISQETKAAKVLNAERRAEKARREAEYLRTQEENLKRWIEGEDVYTGFQGLPVHLRIKDNEIQTTRGANVPLIEARKFWNTLQRKENVEGMRLGHYTVTRIDGTTLIVGCHQIPLKEVYRTAKNLNWLEAA